MNVLIACEYSATVRDAFRRRGHDAWSCDLLPTEGDPRYHLQRDVLGCLEGWDLIIAHPPCTHLAASGARWWKDKGREQHDAIKFVIDIAWAPCPRIAIENPIGRLSSVLRKPHQIIQPWQFGHAESKATCLWLKNLPILVPTNVVEPEYKRRPDGSLWLDKKGKRCSVFHWDTFRLPKDVRAKERSRTYQGIADAMAEQWGSHQSSAEDRPRSDSPPQ